MKNVANFPLFNLVARNCREAQRKCSKQKIDFNDDELAIRRTLRRDSFHSRVPSRVQLNSFELSVYLSLRSLLLMFFWKWHNYLEISILSTVRVRVCVVECGSCI